MRTTSGWTLPGGPLHSFHASSSLVCCLCLFAGASQSARRPQHQSACPPGSPVCPVESALRTTLTVKFPASPVCACRLHQAAAHARHRKHVRQTHPVCHTAACGSAARPLLTCPSIAIVNSDKVPHYPSTHKIWPLLTRAPSPTTVQAQGKRRPPMALPRCRALTRPRNVGKNAKSPVPWCARASCASK